MPEKSHGIHKKKFEEIQRRVTPFSFVEEMAFE
jgi:hypothetical protein